MNSTTYSGWKNYETWNVALWIDNDQGSHEYWRERAQDLLDATDEDEDDRKAEAVPDLARELKDAHEEQSDDMLREAGQASSMWADLLGAALSEVNWHEIAEHMLSDLEPS
jgi:hypothetical protein